MTPPDDAEPAIHKLYQTIEVMDSKNDDKTIDSLLQQPADVFARTVRDLENLAFSLSQEEEEEIIRVRALGIFDNVDGTAAPPAEAAAAAAAAPSEARA